MESIRIKNPKKLEIIEMHQQKLFNSPKDKYSKLDFLLSRTPMNFEQRQI